jgi:hypothetical protein
MRLMTETTARRRAGILARIPAWIGRRQRELSDRVHTAADECARLHGWQVTRSTGWFGLGARSYRDPRFGGRRQQRSAGAVRVEGDQVIGWNEANSYWNEASDHEAQWAPGD